MTAKDHKRKARAIGPATVVVRDGEIVVVVPDVLGKNEAHRRAGKVMHTSAALKKYRASVLAGTAVWRNHPLKTCEYVDVTTIMAWAHDGAWRLDVIGVWPTQNHDVGFVAPRGDADAAIPQALDALQHAGILDDDARVVAVRAWNMYRKDVRATIIRLLRVEPDVRDREAASLVNLAEQVPPQVKPKRAKKTKSEATT